MSEPLRELLALFSIDVDTSELEEGNKKIEGFIDKLKVAAKTVAEAFAVDAVKEFIESQVEAATELERTAQRLGVTTEQVEQFNFAAGTAGVQAESMTTGLRFLNRAIAEAGKGGSEQAQIFAKLGIQLKDADGHTRGVADVMSDLADKISAIPDASKKTQYAMELLGRHGADLIPVLNKGSEAFKEAAKEMEQLGGATSEKVIEGAKKIEEQEVRLKFALSSLKTGIAAELFPVFEGLIKRGVDVVKWLLELNRNTYILHTGMEALGAIGVYKAIKSLDALAKTFGLLKPTILETLAALWEFAAPILIIGALYLIFDDLYTLLQGGESVIGDVLDSLFGLGSAEAFAQGLNDTISVTLDLFEGLAQIVAGLVMPVFESLWEIVKGIVLSLVDLANFNPSQALKDIKGIASGVWDAIKTGGATIAGGAQQIMGMGPDAHPIAAGAGVLAKTREPTDFSFPEAKAHTREPVAVTVGPGTHHGAGGVTVHQQMSLTQHIQTGSDQPKAVGDAAGQGAATAAERGTSNAWQAVRRT